jgi:hypothetical protein
MPAHSRSKNGVASLAYGRRHPRLSRKKNVDGRDKPGHDEIREDCPLVAVAQHRLIARAFAGPTINPSQNPLTTPMVSLSAFPPHLRAYTFHIDPAATCDHDPCPCKPRANPIVPRRSASAGAACCPISMTA